MGNPKISVIIPSFNHSKYIEQAIDSVLSQTFTDFELIIADDCSQDNSRDIINGYKDKRIKSLFPDKNQGAVPILKYLLERTSCDHVALLNSDDYWIPDKLEKQYEIMQQNPELGACFSWAEMVDENGRLLTTDDLPYANIFKVKNRSQGQWLAHFFYNSNCICHPSTLIKKHIYDEIGFYKNYLRQIPDFEMWIRLVKNYPIYMIEESLVYHRRHMLDSSNASAETLGNAIRGRNEIYLVYKTFFDEINDDIFIDGFSKYFFNPNASTNDDFRCEQAFLLLNNKLVPRIFECVAIEKLAHLLQAEGTRNVLADKYFFTFTEYFNLMADKGIGFLDMTAKSSFDNAGKVLNFFEKNPNLYLFIKKVYNFIKNKKKQ